MAFQVLIQGRQLGRDVDLRPELVFSGQAGATIQVTCGRYHIDKAFRIATPMRKASWTKRFAEGWGERRGANGDGGSGGEGWREWAGGVSEKSLPRVRSVREAAPSLAGRRGARVSESAFQVTCPSGSRHAETRILAKEPRPATTAVGTSRQGRVAIRRLVDSSIGRFRQLAQRLREA